VLAQVDGQHWPAPVLQMFTGAISPADAIAGAKTPNPRETLMQQCEAFFYAGQKYLVDGQPEQARVAFQSAVATGVSEFMEYDWSVRELEMMSR
jgi:lipoprotein NlpI